MGNCLVTKLKGSVQNDNLDFLGCISLQVAEIASPSSGTQYVRLITDGPVTISVYGGENNLGFSYGTFDKSEIESAGGEVTFYCKNGTYKVIISNKDNIGTLHINGNGVSIKTEKLTYCTKLTTILGGGIIGDIANLPNTITNFECQVKEMYGNIVSIQKWTNFNPSVLAFYNTKITGNVAEAIQNKTIGQCSLNWTDGETDTTEGLIGDLSTMPASLYSINTNGRKTKFTWSGTRNSSYPAIMLYRVNLTTDIDRMLINQANCNLTYQSSDTKSIVVQGTVFTPENPDVAAAISTIKAAGWLIQINGEDL